jgi:uncharacterized protein with FMN-binding domain
MIDFRASFARTMRLFMNPRIVMLLAAGVLFCTAAAGCGGGSAPPPKREADTAEQAAPPSLVVETMPATQPAVETESSGPREALPDAVRRTFPLAASVKRLSEPFPHRVICDSAGRVLGYEVFSDSAGTTAQGYAGMVPVRVLLDGQGRPMRIYILENCETPAYMELIRGSGLLEKLLGFDPAEPESLDAVTLATSSSKAIIAGVTRLAALVSAELGEPSGEPR